jgi:hypothetical protein
LNCWVGCGVEVFGTATSIAIDCESLELIAGGRLLMEGGREVLVLDTMLEGCPELSTNQTGCEACKNLSPSEEAPRIIT